MVDMLYMVLVVGVVVGFVVSRLRLAGLVRRGVDRLLSYTVYALVFLVAAGMGEVLAGMLGERDLWLVLRVGAYTIAPTLASIVFAVVLMRVARLWTIRGRL